MFLHEVKLFTVCKTSLTKNPKTYILLASDKTHYTVYTNERNGFVMTANKTSASKRIKVEILFEPKHNPRTLLDCIYPETLEEFKQRAIDYLYLNERRLKPQALEVLNKFKNIIDNSPLISIIGVDKNNDEQLPEEFSNKIAKQLFEGAKKSIVVNAYERNIKARKLCVEHWKAKCVVCDFDFEEKYGNFGKGFIHVHHLKPLFQIDSAYEVNPVNDLRPVCPNCHAMLHRQKDTLTIEELKSIIAENVK